MSEPETHQAPGVPAAVARLWDPPASEERRTGLTLGRILDAAMALADEHGLEAVTMARVAERVGFTTMSLYRHVSGKEELLTLMLNAGMAPPASLDGPFADWREGLEHWCHEMRAGLRRHPWIERVPVSGMIGTPSQLGWMDRGLAAMAGTALTEQERCEVLLLINGYVYWDARLAADLAAAEAVGMPIDGFDAIMRAVTDGERFPAVGRAVAAGVFNDDDGDDRDADFAFGLARVLDGVALLIEQRATPPA